ncbi:hypothetical protein HELRODRAFT_180928 [Helobdella robusta]|uniref:HTH psq-type domain-containing protein n=1 Tax=Helobdella robusta TaxID=6412 RepID=T1FGF6_HELRO|nr:hypothetical protein HELRODRAFT_180928 [Helobdella robusta]ESN93398.1 hypothetical protein HELRODRAFT_180928 [Helobdella robusta]
MVRNYIRKSTRCSSYNDESLKIAVESVTNGMPLKTAVKKYGVPARTLKRHQMAMTKFPGKIRLGHFHSIFTKDQELELVEIIKSMEKSLFGMTTTDVRKVAFEFAEKMKLSHPFKVEMKMAGIDWMYGFLKRHPTLSIRKPEAINLSRLVGFNKEQVKIFFDIYLETLNNGNYNAMKIWNVDETGISTVQKPVKIVGSKGLWPPNMNVFSDEDFHPSNLTDEPLPSSALDLNLHSNSLIETIESVVEDDPNQSISSKSLLESIVGPIKSSTPRGRKRKSERATLLTSSPNKKLLQEKDDQNCKKIKRSKDLLDIKSKTVKRTKDTTPCGTCTQIFCKDVTGRQWIKCQKLEEDYNDIFICIECDD